MREGTPRSGHSDRQTTMTLQDMVAAPDEGQLHEEPSSPKMREPVLEFLSTGSRGAAA